MRNEFKNKTVKSNSPEAIVDMFMDLAHQGTPEKVDALFRELQGFKAATRQAIIGEVEKRTRLKIESELNIWERAKFNYDTRGTSIGYGAIIEPECNRFPGDTCPSVELKQSQYYLTRSLVPAMKILEHVAGIQGNKASAWTRAAVINYSKLSKNAKIDSVVKVFADARRTEKKPHSRFKM